MVAKVVAKEAAVAKVAVVVAAAVVAVAKVVAVVAEKVAVTVLCMQRRKSTPRPKTHGQTFNGSKHLTGCYITKLQFLRLEKLTWDRNNRS